MILDQHGNPMGSKPYIVPATPRQVAQYGYGYDYSYGGAQAAGGGGVALSSYDMDFTGQSNLSTVDGGNLTFGTEEVDVGGSPGWCWADTEAPDFQQTHTAEFERDTTDNFYCGLMCLFKTNDTDPDHGLHVDGDVEDAGYMIELDAINDTVYIRRRRGDSYSIVDQAAATMFQAGNSYRTTLTVTVSRDANGYVTFDIDVDGVDPFSGTVTDDEHPVELGGYGGIFLNGPGGGSTPTGNKCLSYGWTQDNATVLTALGGAELTEVGSDTFDRTGSDLGAGWDELGTTGCATDGADLTISASEGYAIFQTGTSSKDRVEVEFKGVKLNATSGFGFGITDDPGQSCMTPSYANANDAGTGYYYRAASNSYDMFESSGGGGYGGMIQNFGGPIIGSNVAHDHKMRVEYIGSKVFVSVWIDGALVVDRVSAPTPQTGWRTAAYPIFRGADGDLTSIEEVILRAA